MMESVLKRIERNRKERERWIALVLCLSMIVSLGVFSGLRMDAIAKTYTRVVLECPYMEEGAERVAHTHNADCYDENGMLVCTLPEVEAHTHSDACYLENTTLVCGLEENPGHRHTDDCYTAETTLVCDLEENEGHQHTGDCYTLERGELLCDNTDEEHEHTDDCFAWNEVLSCGMEAGEGAHLHSEDCYRTEWILTCGMEEGEGAHTHTDECYLTDRVLICDKPEIVLHTHTDDCYQKNDDGSIYVDEDGYAWLICGQPEIIEHVHDADCFAVYELDDGEPEEISVTDEIAEALTEDTDEAEPAATEEHEETDDADAAEEKSETEETDNLTDSEETKDEAKDETKDNTKDNTKDDTKDDTEDENEEETESTDTEPDVPAIPMPAQSFEKLAGGIRVSVEAPEGAFPENTRMSASPVNGNSLKNTVSDAINGEVLEVQAVDIKFYDAEGNEIEPATPIRVSLTPWASAHVDQTTQVVHIDKAGDAEVIEQAADAEPASEREVVFDADSFSIYAIVYSVSFEYEVDGQVFTSSVPGAREIMLSDVLKELNITAEDKIADFMSRIADVSVSAADVLSVTAAETDWTICALKASEDVAFLTVTMQDGAVFSIAVKADGATEVTSENEIAVISTVNDRYLPENATALAEVLDEEKSGSAIAAVQQAAAPAAAEAQENTAGVADAGTKYQVFSIGLENVDATAYDGFNVSVTLPEDAVVGKDFQLYQIREDETVNLTESLEVTGEANENGLQNVSGFTFKTDDFADFVLSYSIETNYTAFDGKTFKISLNYGPEAEIPEGAALKVEEILPDTESYAQYLNDSVTELGVKSGAVSFARFFDIEIQKDGEKIEPQAPVSVTIQMIDLPEETGNAEAQVIHFGEQTEVLTAEAAGTDVSFETGSFSVYGVLYTVDFHYEVNGQTFEFSIPGGGFISLEHLIEALGINVSDAAGTDSATDEAFEEEYTDNSAETAAEETAADPAAEVEAAATAAFEQAISLNNVPVSEETRAFVAEIATVEFSSPELVWIGKVNEESTVGALKEANGLEVEYSANLTEEQIAEINAQTVEAGDWALVSVRPFVSEESLTVTMENGDSFTIRVTDGQIRKTVIDARGDTWEITVTYDENAQIPDGAELKVEEILPENEAYQDYYEKSMESVYITISEETEDNTTVEIQTNDHGTMNDSPVIIPLDTDETFVTEDAADHDNTTTDYIRIFNIEICAEGQKVEPEASVKVSIKLLDAPEEKNSDLRVVHFGTENIEVIETENDIGEKPGEIKLDFTTDSFSVYTVVAAPSSADDLGLTIDYDVVHKGFALFTSDASVSRDEYLYNDYPYDYDKSVKRAMVASIWTNADSDENNDGFDAQAVTVENNTIVGGEASLWCFENADNKTGSHYKLFVFDANGNRQYIHMKGTYNETPELVNNSNNATVFNITVVDGKIALKYDENYGNARYITNRNVGWWNNGKRIFRGYYNSYRGDAGLFTLSSIDENYNEFKATKISAANLQENKEIVIYQKDAEGNLYALADDGTYVPVTESGESVYWRTPAAGKNILWKMTITSSTSGYYDFTSVANPGIHISPSVTDNAVIDSKYIGVTLDGRQNGTYTSTIKAWDDPKYSWVGIEKNGESARQVLGPGDEFMFAEYSTFTTQEPQEVDTVDSSTLGIKIRMFDYYGSSYNTWGSENANENNRLYGMTYAVEGTWNKSDGYIQNQTANLVERNLTSDGLPVSSGNMSWLFSEGDYTYNQNGYTFTRDDRGLANHLFIKSIYDETGYFHYSSAENYAYLENEKTDFKVYQQVASPNVDPRNDQWYFYHGHFMPYNDIDMSKTYDTIRYGQDNAIQYDSSDPRAYEPVYGIKDDTSGHVDNNDKHNFFTGMTMEADFAQLENGLDKYGNPVVFKFTGDDDMWVFIDGVRVLDLGGIHEALSGTINFATGEVNVNGDTSHDLYWFFEQAGKADSVRWKDGPNGHKIFADYTTHSFNMFYMERGAGASNLDLHFNLPVVKSGSFTVAKKLSEPAQSKYANVRFAYRAYLEDGTVLKPGVIAFKGITYEGTNAVVQMDDNGVFYLKPGEAATIQLYEKDTKYYVEELGFDRTLYSHVDIVEEPGTITELESTNYVNYPLSEEYKGEQYKVEKSTTENVANRGRVTYENTPNPLKELHITKKVINSKGQEIYPDPSTTFEFKVFLEGKDGALMPYMQDDYYLIKVWDDGFVHYYDITADGLIHAGYLQNGIFHAETDYVWYNREVDPAGKKVPHTVQAGSTIIVGTEGYELPVCGVSGQNGSIAKIPAGYTVIIKNLLPGTEFYVEERLASPRYYPANYEYVSKEVVEGTADAGTLPTDQIKDNDNQPTAIADGTLMSNVNGEVIVTNRLLALDIVVEKIWENGSAAPEAQVEIEIGRYHLVKTDGSEDVQTGTMTIHDSYSGLESDVSYSAAYTLTGEGIEQTKTGNGGVVTFTNLPVGDYNVIKSVTGPDGYILTTPVSETKQGSVPQTGTGEVFFSTSIFSKDHVEPETATLTIHDSYSGISSGYSASYRVTGPDYDKTFTGSGNNVEVTGLTVGESYTVEKTASAVSGYTAEPVNETKSQTIASGGSNVTFAQTVFAPQSSSDTVKFYIYKTGSSEPLKQYDVYTNSSYVFTFDWTNGKNSFTIGEHPYSIQYGNNSHTIQVGNTDIAAYFPQYECDPTNINVSQIFEGDTLMTSYRSIKASVASTAANLSTQTSSLEREYTPTASTIASLPTPPEGYEWRLDTGYTKTIILKNGVWSNSITEEKTDNNGRNYYYYIKKVVETGIPEGTEAIIGTNLVGYDTDNKTLRVTNNLPFGSLEIIKNVTYNNGAVPAEKMALVNKSFSFAVTKDNQPIEGSPFTVTVSDGQSSSILVEGLTAGNYVITEVESAGLTLTEVTGGAGNGSKETRSVTVEVTAGKIAKAELLDSAKASFTNNYSESEIVVKKVDANKADSQSNDKYLDGAVFTLLDAASHALPDGSYTITDLEGTPITINAKKEFTIPETGVKISGLSNGSYKLVECEAPAGYLITSDTANTTFTVADGQVTEWSMSGEPQSTFEIPNPPGKPLPMTGGIGTNLFTVIGGILSATAGAILTLTSYRRRKKQYT